MYRSSINSQIKGSFLFSHYCKWEFNLELVIIINGSDPLILKIFDFHKFLELFFSDGPRFQEDEFHQQNTTRTIKSFIGSTVDIYCNIVSLPFGVVQWYRKGNIPLKHNQQRYPLLPGKSDRYYYFLLDKYRNPTILRLNRVIYNDRDEYTCNVTGAGIRLSWSTLLKVKGNLLRVLAEDR